MARQIFFCTLLLALFTFAGCGPSFSPVQGSISLDGKPLDKATITLVSEDGKSTYIGQSDETGNFSIGYGDQIGATSGNYKVIISKPKPSFQMAEGATVGDADYMKAMEKMGKENQTKSKSGGGMKGPGGMLMPPGSGPGIGMAPPQPKTDIPTIYASITSTPLSVTVPVSNPPVKFELTTPAKKK